MNSHPRLVQVRQHALKKNDLAARALRERFDRHRAIARWTFPLWLYVSITGVLVYFMLYQWFAPAQ